MRDLLPHPVTPPVPPSEPVPHGMCYLLTLPLFRTSCLPSPTKVKTRWWICIESNSMVCMVPLWGQDFNPKWLMGLTAWKGSRRDIWGYAGLRLMSKGILDSPRQPLIWENAFLLTWHHRLGIHTGSLSVLVWISVCYLLAEESLASFLNIVCS